MSVGAIDATLVSHFVLLLLTESTRLIQLSIVWPRVQRRKTLIASIGSTSTILNAVRSGLMPRLTNDKGPVVAPISRPKVLRGGEGCFNVLLDSVQIQRGKGLGVIKVWIRVVEVLLLEDAQVQPIWEKVID